MTNYLGLRCPSCGSIKATYVPWRGARGFDAKGVRLRRAMCGRCHHPFVLIEDRVLLGAEAEEVADQVLSDA